MLEFFEYADKVESDEDANTIGEQKSARQETSLERALEDHLKNQKLARSEINQIIDSNRVF